ncbi:MAG: hypothetical protein K2Q22_18090, partial [Cytophagales bacterium]|nr:hypothetical protein [Cytophagales bacterium]
AGYIFNPQTPLLLELSYTIFAQFWKKGGIGIITGFYDFSGDHADNFHNMFGVYFRYGILRAENGGILNIGRIMHAHRLRMGRH